MCLLENVEAKVFQYAVKRFVSLRGVGKSFVSMVSGAGDAGCRDGPQRSGGAGVVSEPES